MSAKLNAISTSPCTCINGPADDAMPRATETGLYRCRDCGGEFAGPKLVTIPEDSNDGEFGCDLCGKPFSAGDQYEEDFVMCCLPCARLERTVGRLHTSVVAADEREMVIDDDEDLPCERCGKPITQHSEDDFKPDGLCHRLIVWFACPACAEHVVVPEPQDDSPVEDIEVECVKCHCVWTVTDDGDVLDIKGERQCSVDHDDGDYAGCECCGLGVIGECVICLATDVSRHADGVCWDCRKPDADVAEQQDGPVSHPACVVVTLSGETEVLTDDLLGSLTIALQAGPYDDSPKTYRVQVVDGELELVRVS